MKQDHCIVEDPTLTISALAEALGISTRAVEMQIKQLKNERRLERVWGGGRKGRREVGFG